MNRDQAKYAKGKDTRGNTLSTITMIRVVKNSLCMESVTFYGGSSKIIREVLGTGEILAACGSTQDQ